MPGATREPSAQSWRTDIILGGAVVAAVCSYAHAAPEGAKVVAGKVDIQRSGALTTIRAGDNSIINFRSFDLARNETVRFIQPSETSRVLNRITSSTPTLIDGSIFANGRVFFVNPAGVTFGGGAVVTANQIVAGAGSISNADFLRGVDRFTGLNGRVDNFGALNARTVALLGRSVANYGAINAPAGTVIMASGEDILIGRRNERIFAKISAAGRAAGEASVTNAGAINAPGGKVGLAAADTYGVALFNLGTIRARAARLDSGAQGRTVVSGSIDVSDAAGRGGDARVLGDRVELRGASIDASGRDGGGTVNVGGNFQGRGPDRASTLTFADAESVVRADATAAGPGGQVVFWSDHTTAFYGRASAAGEGAGANGGLIETSGKVNLDVRGAKVDARGRGAATAGTWLLDPTDIEIKAMSTSGGTFDPLVNPATFTPVGSPSTAVVDVADINAALDAGNNVMIATASTGSGAGDITVSDVIQRTTGMGDVTITLNATRAIAFNFGTPGSAILAGPGAGKVHLSLTAGGDITIVRTISTGGGTISLRAGGDIDVGTSLFAASLDSGGGAITAGANGAFRITNVSSVLAGAADVTVNSRSVSVGPFGSISGRDVAITSGVNRDGTFVMAGGNLVSGGTINGSHDTTLKAADGSITLTGNTGAVTGALSVRASKNIDIGAGGSPPPVISLSGASVVIQAGSPGIATAAPADNIGTLSFTGPVTIASGPSIVLRAGTTTGDIVATTSALPSFTFTGGTRSLTLSKGASFADADLPTPAQYGGAVPGGLALSITSNSGSVTIDTAAKVAGTNLTVQAATGVSVNQAISLASGRLTTDPSSTITLNGSIDATHHLRLEGAVNQTGGIITTPVLSLGGAGTKTLDQANAVTTLGGDFTGNLVLRNATAFTVDDVSNYATPTPATIHGLRTVGDVTLITNAGAVTLANGVWTYDVQAGSTPAGSLTILAAGASQTGVSAPESSLKTGRLLLSSSTAGDFTLANPNNTVSELAAQIDGSLTLQSGGTDLELVQASGLTGIRSADRNVTLTVRGGHALNVRQRIDVSGGAGSGVVTLAADAMDIAAPVTSGAGPTAGGVWLRPFTNAATIGLGTGAGTLSLTQAELLNITTPVLQIGHDESASDHAGLLTASTLNLSSKAYSLVLRADGMNLDALNLLGAGRSLTLSTNLHGTPGHDVAATGAVVAERLVLLGRGGFTLTNAANDFGDLSGDATGSIRVSDANALNVVGVSARVLDSQASAPSAGNVLSSGADILLRTGALPTPASTSTANYLTLGEAAPTAFTRALSASGNITLTADNIDVRDFVQVSGSGTITIRPVQNDRPLVIGGDGIANASPPPSRIDAPGSLGLRQAEIDLLSAPTGTVSIGGQSVATVSTRLLTYNNGNLTISGNNAFIEDDLELTGGRTLTVVANSLGQKAGTTIKATNLLLLGSGNISLTGANDFDFVAGRVDGSLRLRDANGFIVTTLTATGLGAKVINGVSNGDPVVGLAAIGSGRGFALITDGLDGHPASMDPAAPSRGSIRFDQPVNVGPSGTLVLASRAATPTLADTFSQSADGTITAGKLLISAVEVNPTDPWTPSSASGPSTLILRRLTATLDNDANTIDRFAFSTPSDRVTLHNSVTAIYGGKSTAHPDGVADFAFTPVTDGSMTAPEPARFFEFSRTVATPQVPSHIVTGDLDYRGNGTLALQDRLDGATITFRTRGLSQTRDAVIAASTLLDVANYRAPGATTDSPAVADFALDAAPNQVAAVTASITAAPVNGVVKGNLSLTNAQFLADGTTLRALTVTAGGVAVDGGNAYLQAGSLGADGTITASQVRLVADAMRLDHTVTGNGGILLRTLTSGRDIALGTVTPATGVPGSVLASNALALSDSELANLHSSGTVQIGARGRFKTLTTDPEDASFATGKIGTGSIGATTPLAFNLTLVGDSVYTAGLNFGTVSGAIGRTLGIDVVGAVAQAASSVSGSAGIRNANLLVAGPGTDPNNPAGSVTLNRADNVFGNVAVRSTGTVSLSGNNNRAEGSGYIVADGGVTAGTVSGDVASDTTGSFTTTGVTGSALSLAGVFDALAALTATGGDALIDGSNGVVRINSTVSGSGVDIRNASVLKLRTGGRVTATSGDVSIQADSILTTLPGPGVAGFQGVSASGAGRRIAISTASSGRAIDLVATGSDLPNPVAGKLQLDNAELRLFSAETIEIAGKTDAVVTVAAGGAALDLRGAGRRTLSFVTTGSAGKTVFNRGITLGYATESGGNAAVTLTTTGATAFDGTFTLAIANGGAGSGFDFGRAGDTGTSTGAVTLSPGTVTLSGADAKFSRTTTFTGAGSGPMTTLAELTLADHNLIFDGPTTLDRASITTNGTAASARNIRFRSTLSATSSSISAGRNAGFLTTSDLSASTVTAGNDITFGGRLTVKDGTSTITTPTSGAAILFKDGISGEGATSALDIVTSTSSLAAGSQVPVRFNAPSSGPVIDNLGTFRVNAASPRTTLPSIATVVFNYDHAVGDRVAVPTSLRVGSLAFGRNERVYSLGALTIEGRTGGPASSVTLPDTDVLRGNLAVNSREFRVYGGAADGSSGLVIDGDLVMTTVSTFTADGGLVGILQPSTGTIKPSGVKNPGARSFQPQTGKEAEDFGPGTFFSADGKPLKFVTPRGVDIINAGSEVAAAVAGAVHTDAPSPAEPETPLLTPQQIAGLRDINIFLREEPRMRVLHAGRNSKIYIDAPDAVVLAADDQRPSLPDAPTAYQITPRRLSQQRTVATLEALNRFSAGELASAKAAFLDAWAAYSATLPEDREPSAADLRTYMDSQPGPWTAEIERLAALYRQIDQLGPTAHEASFAKAAVVSQLKIDPEDLEAHPHPDMRPIDRATFLDAIRTAAEARTAR